MKVSGYSECGKYDVTAVFFGHNLVRNEMKCYLCRTDMQPRKSNIELLRIISMLMVLAVHVDGASLGLPSPGGDFASLTARDIWRIAVEAVAIIGVNSFTMISGYFGIRLRWRGMLSFLFECVFYSVGIYTVATVAFGRFTWGGWLESWMVLTHTDLWYVPAYFGLMLLSPVLNSGLDAMPRRAFLGMLALFAGFNIWCGWWWGGAFNPTGYTIVQLVLVYMIARYIRLHISHDYVRAHRRVFMAVYAVSLIAISATAVCMPSLMAYAYNSPFVLLSTVCFFLVFLSFEFTSPVINYMAGSAFAVYLIHKSPQVWGNVLRPFVRMLWDSLPLPLFSLAAIGIVLGLYLLAVVVDPIRRMLFRAISRAVTSRLE